MTQQLTPIESAKTVRELVRAGWELWHITCKRSRASSFSLQLPGQWELRLRNRTRPVMWDAIIRLRRDLDWWRRNTEELEVGRDWCYRFRQASFSEIAGAAS